jgi:hypothetical protein
LNAEGTDYLSHGSFVDEAFADNWQTLRSVLEDAPRKLTRAQVGKRWPAEGEAPAATTLWRWLERAVGQGLVLREGTGRKSAPYHYWLPGKEEEWKRPAWEKELEALRERFSKPPADPPPEPRAAPPDGSG